MKPRVLLLNPPADRNYTRDYFLGGVAEPELLLPPADLACLSGLLRGRADVAVLDAPAEGLAAPAALRRAIAAKPDAVIFDTAGVSFEVDRLFLEELKAGLPRARFIGLGDLYRDVEDQAFALQPFLDAVLLDFSTDDVLAYLSGERGPIPNMIHREAGVVRKGPARHQYGEWAPPPPQWELFPLTRYRWPFSKGPKRAGLLTDFGCPYICGYCPAGSLAHRQRSVDTVLAEWKALAALGVRDVFVRDQTFGADRPRAVALLEAIKRADTGMSWVCTTRVDVPDADLLVLMKQAGCAAVIFGVDSGDDEVLRAYKKTTTRAQAVAAVSRARAAGLKVWGQFVLGLAMDTRETVERTLAFSKELKLDWVSVRAENQRHAVDYRREMLVKGFVPPESMPPDTPTSISVWHGRMGVSNRDTLTYLERAGRKDGLRLAEAGAPDAGRGE